MMKVLSLMQPWATLVVIGAKIIETRGFSTKHRGPVLIHASKEMLPFNLALCELEPFRKALKDIDEFPLGHIIGKVDILESKPVDFFKQCSKGVPLRTGRFSKKQWDIELAFGDYSAGRYGWALNNPVAFDHHIPFSGGVGFTKEFDARICLSCGCTNDNCLHCIEKTGQPCYWVAEHLCSACVK